MAQPYSTGPAIIYVGLGGSTPVELGTAENGPRIMIDPKWEDLFNDLGGKTPFDKMYQGESAVVSATLTVWDELVYTALAARFSPGLTRGIDIPTARGTLMLTEGQSYPLWVQYPFVIKAAYSASMPGCYRFNAAMLIGPDALEPGVKVYKIQMIWACLGLYDPSIGFSLYDHDDAGLRSFAA